MSKKLFSIPLLGVIQHTEETKEILAPYAKERKQSEFVREAIIKFANNLGFDYIFGYVWLGKIKPNYIPTLVWQQILIKQQKSYGVDYTYAIAFYWLKSLDQFKHYCKAKLVKEIVTASH